MKYLFLGALIVPMVAIALTMGAIAYLYRFKKNDFLKGVRWMDSKTNYTKWFDKEKWYEGNNAKVLKMKSI